MVGRDLIIYILQNHLEDEPVFKDGKFVGFMTTIEAAVKYDVGVASIESLFKLGLLDGVMIGDEIYIRSDTGKKSYEPKGMTDNE